MLQLNESLSLQLSDAREPFLTGGQGQNQVLLCSMLRLSLPLP